MLVRSTMVLVPDALLSHPRLGKSAKLLWIVIHQLGGGSGTGLLHARSGLARHTVLRALAELRAAGWLPDPPTGAGPGPGGVSALAAPDRTDAAGPASAGATAPSGAAIPADLLPDRHVSAQAKLLYAVLYRIAGPTSPRGQCTYTELCHQTGLSLNTVKRAVRALVAAGWLELSHQHKFSPVHFLLCNPVARRQDEAVALAARRLQEARFRGEGLMRAYLTLLVDSDEYDDDASPAFLVNPFTNEEMEFDRYYHVARVALEYNGAQHYGTTEHYPDQTQLLKQQLRDHCKRLICAKRGIDLVVVHPEDLSLQGMRQKLKGRLPLRNLAGREAVAAYLEQESRAYRRKARAWRPQSARAGATQSA